MSEQLITKRDEVKSLLRKLFRSEDADLDFGIYRIMNYKRREIEQFIDQDLIETAEAEFKQYAKVGTADLEKELEQLKSEINSNFGTRTIDSEGRVTRNHDAPKVQRYLRTQEEYRVATLTEEQVNDVFNHVYEFFSRYYNDGDFITRPKDSWKSKYSIPYKGEEVTLHWATKNMYYVKTGEFFKKYNFKAGRYRVSFVLVDAQVETGNAKGEKKFFILSDEEPVQIDEAAREVKIKFNYRKLTDAEKSKYGTRNIQATLVSETLKKMGSLLEQSSIVGILRPRGDEEKSLMEKHLNSYVYRNTKDFFIHKDLKGFLERELDFYLKNEVWSLDELESSSESGARLLVAKVKTIRGISLKIIEFLSQIEEFQKKLFEKKKLVLRTNYCMTLDLVPEEFYEEIGRNRMQVSEWKEFYNLDEITNGNFSTKGKTTLTIDFLKQYKYMALDTKFFQPKFGDKLLETFDNIDEKVDGILIHSENHQALNLISRKYKRKVKFSYIDQPYNTGGDEFNYKDNYLHSSWLSMMETRLMSYKELSHEKGIIFISVDDHEKPRLELLLESIFGRDPSLGPIIVQVNKGGRDYLPIAKTHEYIICCSTGNQAPEIFGLAKETEYKFEDKRGKWVNRELRNRNPKFNRGNRPNLYYPFYVDSTNCDSYGFCSVSLKETERHIIEVYPKDSKGRDDCWRWGKKKVEENISFIDTENSEIVSRQKLDGGWNIYEKYRKTTKKAKSIWDDSSVRTENGTIQLRNLFGKSLYDFPKPVELIEKCLTIGSDKQSIIIDFFAGSGTTAHAVIKLNSKDNGNRKYILVEMADYFNSIMIPRIKKVIFSDDWKNGMPQSRSGYSHIFKYLILEQYEDTLNNIEFISPDGTIQRTLERFPDYFISYMLDYETRDSPTRLSIEKFKTPFKYKIKTLSGGEEREDPVDLVETFNYLLGLHIKRIHTYENGDRVYRAVFGELDREQVAVIWRDTSGLDLRRDKRFIEVNILADSTFDTIYVNGDSYVRNAKPIEPEFRRLMDA